MSKRILKVWFYLEMVSHRAINYIMQTPKKEVHFYFFSFCCIVFNCSWQLIIFDKKQKSCVKRIHLVTDDGLYDRKAFYTEKNCFLFILNEWWQVYQLQSRKLHSCKCCKGTFQISVFSDEFLVRIAQITIQNSLLNADLFLFFLVDLSFTRRAVETSFLW